MEGFAPESRGTSNDNNYRCPTGQNSSRHFSVDRCGYTSEDSSNSLSVRMDKYEKTESKTVVSVSNDKRVDSAYHQETDTSSNVDNDSASRETTGWNLRTRSKRRIIPEKVRYRRQTLQDMARPLKHWLYHHRNNPYPCRSEKVALAAGSHMTLIQVSNWFANARRRLKNTVREPRLDWASRIKHYNEYVVGNAELFSVSSDDSVLDFDDESGDLKDDTFPIDQSETISEENHTEAVSEDLVPSRANTPTCTHGLRAENVFTYSEDFSSHLKYKNTILQRYLNDHYQHTVHLDDGELPHTRGRRQSGSLGSRDYEEMSTSSASSRHNDTSHRVFDDFFDEPYGAVKRRRMADENSVEDAEMYWKTIDAAYTLTNLARASQKH